MSRAAILIDERKAKRMLASLMARANAGQDFIIIMRDGQPYARLVSNTPRRPTSRSNG